LNKVINELDKLR